MGYSMNTIAVGLGSCAFGLAVGIGMGWVARGNSQPASAVGVIQPAAIQAPQGALDKPTAEKLILAQLDRGTTCEWRQPSRTTDKEWTFADYEEHAACARALEKIGIVKLGECMNPSGRDCYKRVISAGGSRAAKLGSEAGESLVFQCGKIKFVGITSISTNGSSANIKYEREFVPDEELLDSINVCKLEKPEPGKKIRERIAKRDDAGVWSIVQQ